MADHCNTPRTALSIPDFDDRPWDGPFDNSFEGRISRLRRMIVHLGYCPDCQKPAHDSECVQDDALKRAAAAIAVLTDEERLNLFTDYCRGCGTADLPCHCQNDE